MGAEHGTRNHPERPDPDLILRAIPPPGDSRRRADPHRRPRRLRHATTRSGNPAPRARHVVLLDGWTTHFATAVARSRPRLRRDRQPEGQACAQPHREPAQRGGGSPHGRRPVADAGHHRAVAGSRRLAATGTGHQGRRRSRLSHRCRHQAGRHHRPAGRRRGQAHPARRHAHGVGCRQRLCRGTEPHHHD